MDAVDGRLRGVLERGERLLSRELLDPVPLRMGRLVRAAWRIHAFDELHPSAAPAVAWRAVRDGLSLRTVHALHALHSPGRVALVDARGAYTYAETDRLIDRAAAAFHDQLRIGSGDGVVLALDNRAEYVVAWFALMRLGARAIHASHASRPGELAYVIDHSRARAVLVCEASAGAGKDAGKTRPRLAVVFVGDRGGDPGSLRYDDLLGRARPLGWTRARRFGGASESIVYTSGTTGRPRGAVRELGRFGVVEAARLLDRLPFRVADRHLVVAPLHHSGAQAVTLLHSALGATVHLHARFDAEATLRALSQLRIHSVFLVPTMIRRLLEIPAAVRAGLPTPELRALVSGTSELSETLRRAAIDAFGAPVVHDFYGATELGWVTLIDGTEMLTHPRSVGRPMPGQSVAIFDRGGRKLPTGETGLVYVRNDQTMDRYLDDVASTAATRRGPWVTVEDLGYLDAEGYLYIVGRARDMVKSGGVNLYPVEIEEAIARHPGVRDVAVLGLPDPEWGERLAAVVVPRDAIDVADLDRFARDNLSPVKVPKEWHLVGDLPRNATGKVLKGELRARLGAHTGG